MLWMLGDTNFLWENIKFGRTHTSVLVSVYMNWIGSEKSCWFHSVVIKYCLYAVAQNLWLFGQFDGRRLPVLFNVYREERVPC